MGITIEDLLSELTNKKGGMIIPGKSEKNISDSLKSILSKMKNVRDELQDLTKEKVEDSDKGKEDEGPCFCKECLNFETFEEVLGNHKGKIDYTEFTVGGKEFKVKYWTNGVLNHIAVRPVEVIEKQELQDLRDQKIKLADLVRDYTEAGEFISAQKTITDLLVVSNKIVIMENSNRNVSSN